MTHRETPAPPPPVRPLAATTRYCAALARFGLTPTQCLAGAGARYDAALRALVAEARHGR